MEVYETKATATYEPNMVLEKEGADDLRDIMKILDSFEVISRK